MNHTYFSASCACTRENITCLSCEGGQDEHYTVDADQMCRDSHVCPNMWVRGGGFVPFACGCCGKKFDSLSDVEAEEDVCLDMEVDVFRAWGDRFSHSHGGRFWNSGPLLPFSWVWSDPLHLFLNIFNVAFDEGVGFFLQHEFVSTENKVLIRECDSISREINSVLARAHITARFGTAERKSFCGNDLRAMMEHPSVLPDMLSLVRPLYQRMEPYSFAADAAKARREQAKAVERLEKEQASAKVGGGGKQKAARFDADDFNSTAGISKQAATRIRKQQAAVEVARDQTRTYEERFEAHVLQMQQAVDGNYGWRVVFMLTALVNFYEFVHAKKWLGDALAADADQGAGVVGYGVGRGPAVRLAVTKRKEQCKEQALALAQDIVSTVGTAREQTYLHDLVYGLHRVWDVVLHPLLAGMQGCEHVNKDMKLCLVSQCTAGNNNRYSKGGERLLGDVAQAAVAKVVRQHISVHRAEHCPQNQYGQRLLGRLGWGSGESIARVAKHEHKVFLASSSAGMNALAAGTYSPVLVAAAVASPGTMADQLNAPSRKRRYDVAVPSQLRPDFLEPEPRE